MTKLSKKALEDFESEVKNKYHLKQNETWLTVFYNWLNEEIYYNRDCGYIDCRQCFKHENDYKLISRYKLYEKEEE